MVSGGSFTSRVSCDMPRNVTTSFVTAVIGPSRELSFWSKSVVWYRWSRFFRLMMTYLRVFSFSSMRSILALAASASFSCLRACILNWRLLSDSMALSWSLSISSIDWH